MLSDCRPSGYIKNLYFFTPLARTRFLHDMAESCNDTILYSIPPLLVKKVKKVKNTSTGNDLRRFTPFVLLKKVKRTSRSITAPAGLHADQAPRDGPSHAVRNPNPYDRHYTNYVNELPGLSQIDTDIVPKVRMPLSRVGIPRDEPIFNEAIREEFLRLVAATGVLTKTALALGVHPQTVIRHRKADEEFDKCVQMALELHRDEIDLAVYRRAIEGWDEPVYQRGEKVGVIRKYSDSLLAMYAKRHNPAYRDQLQIDANVKHAVLVVDAPAMTAEDMMKEAMIDGD